MAETEQTENQGSAERYSLDPDTITAAGARLTTAERGMGAAAKKAREFARRYPKESVQHAFWITVAESIEDVMEPAKATACESCGAPVGDDDCCTKCGIAHGDPPGGGGGKPKKKRSETAARRRTVAQPDRSPRGSREGETMKPESVFTARTKLGNYKAYAKGHSARYGNERVLTIPGQAHRGFKTREEAAAFVVSKFPTWESLTSWAAKAGDGQFISKEKLADMGAQPIAPVDFRGAPKEPTKAKPEAKAPPAPVVERHAELAATVTPAVPAEPPTPPVEPEQVAIAEVQASAEEDAVHRFNRGEDKVLHFLRVTREVQRLMAEQDQVWGELVAHFGSKAAATTAIDAAHLLSRPRTQPAPAPKMGVA